jgi:dipeptidyl aminopeptidase/acylaminoacyl peptidase
LTRSDGALAALIALAWLVAPACADAQARPVTLDDVLAMRTFGEAAVSPDGQWAIYERRGAYDASPRFDQGARSWWGASELMLVATRSGKPRPLLVAKAGVGYLLGSWSPDGERVLVYRLDGDRLEAGVVTLPTGEVRWTGLTPDLPITGAGSDWIDGRRLALTVRADASLPWMLRFDGSGARVMDRRWSETAAGRRPSRTVFDTRDAAVSSDELSALLTLVLIDSVSGATDVLAEGRIRDIAVSPDGQWLAVLKAAEPIPLVEAERNVQSAVLRRGRLTLVSVVGQGPAVSAGPLDVAPNLLRWSPASDEVLVWTRRDDQGWADGGLAAVGVDGRVRRIASTGLSPTGEGRTVDELRPIRADWLGDKVILYARKAGTSRSDWWGLDGERPVPLTVALARTPERLAAVEDGRALVFADEALWEMTAGGLRRLSSSKEAWSQGQADDPMKPVRVRATAPRRTWAAAAAAATIGVRSLGGVAAWQVRTPCAQGPRLRAASPTAAVVLCVDRGVETLSLATPAGLRIVDRVNEAFEDLVIPQARPIAHRDVRGRMTQSFLYLPPGLAASEVKGVLVQVYPGIADDGRRIDAQSLQSSLRPQLLTSGGYAVLSVGLPTQAESARAEMFEDFARGVDLAVEAMLIEFPELPRDRLALIGHSFGGYAALGVATRTDRFRSLVVWAAPTDMAGKWGEFMSQGRLWPQDGLTLNQPIGAVETGQAGMGNPPWDAVRQYADASPYWLADRIHTPLLLITADRDYVPMTQSERMFTALHRQGRRARLIAYWGEGHDNASPANIRDVYHQIFDWLDQTIGAGAVTSSDPGEPPTP